MFTVNNYSIQIHGPRGRSSCIKLSKPIPGILLSVLDTLASLNKDYKFSYQTDNVIHFNKGKLT